MKFRKVIMAAAVAMMASSAVAGQTWNCGADDAEVTCTLADGTLTVSGEGAMRNYTTSFASPWNGSRNSIVAVVIEDGVTHIGNYAFYYSSKLASVNIPNSVTYIGNYAFDGCQGLTSIDLPNSVTHIGNYAFHYCPGLTLMEIPNSVTYIGQYAFANSIGLTSITIPTDLTVIEWGVFSGCKGLTSITIPPGVTTIRSSAFSGCEGLTSIDIPNGVTSIDDKVFQDCKGLTSIDIPNSVTTIGSEAFRNCAGLTSITIPGSVTSVGNDAFENCVGLTSVELPSSVDRIGSYVFNGCTNIDTVKISGTGYMSYNLASWFFNNSYPFTTVIIGDGVTGITEFRDFVNLTSVELPSSVTIIADRAFEGCTGLTSINIPDGVTHIRMMMFSGCKGLTSITIPSSVTNIAPMAFSGCTGLTSITIPAGVTSIGAYAFSSCNKLDSIIIKGPPTVIGEDGLAYVPAATCLYVPAQYQSAYAAKNWFGFTCKGTIDENVSVKQFDRVTPQSKPDEGAAVIAPVSVTAFEFTVGPNPVNKLDGVINLFVTGKRVDDGTLTVYDGSGNVVRKINVNGNSERRIVGSWDLRDAKNRPVSEGTYLLRGSVKTTDGKREKVSVIVGVR